MNNNNNDNDNDNNNNNNKYNNNNNYYYYNGFAKRNETNVEWIAYWHCVRHQLVMLILIFRMKFLNLLNLIIKIL